MFKIIGAIDAEHVAVEYLLINRPIGLSLHHRLRGNWVDELQILESYLVDRSQVRWHGNQLVMAQRSVFLRRDGELCKPIGHLACCSLAKRADLWQVVKVAG